MKIFSRERVSKGALAYTLPLASAIWYTFRIEEMGKALGTPEGQFLYLSDIPAILVIWIFSAGILSCLLHRILPVRFLAEPDEDRKFFLPCFFFMVLWNFPFLLAFYPAPGMNDTVFMMDNPLWGAVQFPWLYSVIYGYGSQWGKELFGSREPVIFILSLLQLFVYDYGLTGIAFRVRRKFGKIPGIFLWAYFAFFPMIGNYGIAAVRDGLFSLALALSVILIADEEEWGKKQYILLSLSFLGMMLLRSNGIFISFFLCGAVIYLLKKWKKPLLLFLLCAAISFVPGRVILSYHDWEPHFQESMAVPLQQLGRVLVMDGYRSEETKALMNELLAEDQWKANYYPETVDFVKWHDDFRRNSLNREKKRFLLCWLDTGLHNPRIYMEGWMTETYSLWNVIPDAPDVQSRFGWALSDENTKNMKPADNDNLAVGSFPMAMTLKSFLVNLEWEGSHFMGPGLCLWLTLLLCLLFYGRGNRKGILAAVPLLANTLTLLVSTPASAVFRYSFAYVLGLPVLLIYFLYQDDSFSR